jgi:uncharacterized phiE125 gp8 family phage protein
MYDLIRIAGPAVDPLSLQEIKDHLRITVDDAQQDADLSRKLKAATRYIEDQVGPLITQTWEYWRDGFPARTYIDIPKRPILSIDEISSLDDDDVETILVAADAYYTSLPRGRILLRPDVSWPTDVRLYRSVRIQFTAGYGPTPDDVPDDLREAVAEMTGYLFYDREGIDPIPLKVREIIAGHEPVAV